MTLEAVSDPVGGDDQQPVDAGEGRTQRVGVVEVSGAHLDAPRGVLGKGAG